MDSIKMNTATEYGFYYAPVFSYYFSTGYLAWKKAYGSERNRSLQVYLYLHLYNAFEAGSFTGPAFLIANESVMILLTEPKGGRKR